MARYILSNFTTIDIPNIKIISSKPGLILIEANSKELDEIKIKYKEIKITKEKILKLC